MQIDLRRAKFHLYQEDQPVAFFSNLHLACETAYLRWKFNVHLSGTELLLRHKPLQHSVRLPATGKYIWACDMQMDGHDYQSHIMEHEQPWKRGEISEAVVKHWAVIG